jgi:hypothetical protein
MKDFKRSLRILKEGLTPLGFVILLPVWFLVWAYLKIINKLFIED